MSTRSDIRKLLRVESVLERDMHAYLLRNGDITLEEEWVREKIIEAISKPHYRAPGWHPSTVMSCRRAQMFERIGVPSERAGNLDADLLNIFADGSWRHLRLQAHGLLAGVLTDIEVKCESKRWGLVGSADGEGEHRRTGDIYGVEFKGVHHMHAGLPLSNHLWQVESYLLMRPHWAFMVIMYEDKGSQQWREFIIRRNPTRRALLKRRLRGLNHLLVNEELPNVKEGCRAQKGKEYKECAYRQFCLGCTSWEQAEAAAA